MEQQGPDSWELLSDTFIRIGDFVGKGFQTRRIPPWTETQWRERLAVPGVMSWLAYVENEVAGFLEFEAQTQGNVEIVSFGLVPEFIGKGYGGHILTIAAQEAWNAHPIDELPVQRVWLHTSTRDHPAALPNYQKRGFCVFHTEDRQREVSLKYEG